MKTKSAFSTIILVLTIIISSCSKTDNPSNSNAESMDDLQISSTFDWSTSYAGNLQVNIIPENGIDLSNYENMVLDLYNPEGEKISRQGIMDGKATFVFKTSKAFDKLTIKSPQTEEEIEVQITEDIVNFNLSYIDLKSIMADSDNDGVDDSVDDYPTDPNRAYRTTYHYWLVYEDLWPSTGDYDFNDIVIEAFLHEADNAQNQLVGGDFDIILHSVGASYHLGLGMQWFSATNGYNTMNYLNAGTVTFSGGGVTADPAVDNAVIVFDDAFDVMEENLSNGNSYYYANNGTGATMIPDTISFTYFINGVNINEWITAYIFYTDERGHEIQVFGMPPTTAANMNLMGTLSDNSLSNWTASGNFNPPLNFYETSNHLPWGLELTYSDFKPPLEKVSILDAYPQFEDWAESEGSMNTNWGNNPDPTKVFDLENEL